MKLYYAPLEGNTGYIYRNLHAELFGGADKYFAPFISPSPELTLHPKERRDLKPEHNQGIPLVPQILTNRAEVFVSMADRLCELGYREVNLNIGCPSRTVVSKGKGAGFLASPDALDAFFEQVFQETTVPVSVKTRIGIQNAEEFSGLLRIFNRYPIHELTIHPRLQKEYYLGQANREIFAAAMEESKVPLCYNGDIFTAEDYRELMKQFPKLQAVMLGRGVLCNPALMREIRGGAPLNKAELRQLHDRLMQDYQDYLSGNRNVLYRMKEFWTYAVCMFADSKKAAKKIRKAQKLSDYLNAVDELFAAGELLPEAGFHWED